VNTRPEHQHVFFGDPALRLKFPAPAAPEPFQASAGNARVDLGWTEPVPAGAGYRIFRNTSASRSSATLITSSDLPPGTTTYADTGLTNTVTYYYWIATVDAQGFEGPWNGPVAATPLNPDPPTVPTGLALRDLHTGAALEVSWNANSESDLDHYVLRWGTTPGGPYPNSLNTGDTTVVLSGLTQGVAVSAVVSAVNTPGKESAPSTEAQGTPWLSSQIRPPAEVTDLLVGRSGNDLVLSWAPVATTLYGEALAVDHYEVYRNDGPGYSWSFAGSVPTASPAGPSFTDPGAAADGLDHSYRVLAVDASGLRGPGARPPGAVTDLEARLSTAQPGRILLRWSPPATWFDGAPLDPAEIAAYRIYRPSSLAGAEDRGGGTDLLAEIPAPPTSCTVEAGFTAWLCDDTAAPDLSYVVTALTNRGDESPY